MRTLLMALMVLVLSPSIYAQNADPGLHGSWKYLRSFNYVHVDDQDRVFQCRIGLDLNVFFAIGEYTAGGVIDWEPARFFSLYGKEVVPSGQEWGRNTMELRGRIMFLTVPALYGQSTERMEFDKVPELPVICAHYLALAFDE